MQLHHFFYDIGVLVCRRHWLWTHQKLFSRASKAHRRRRWDVQKKCSKVGRIRAFRDQYLGVGLAIITWVYQSPEPGRLLSVELSHWDWVELLDAFLRRYACFWKSNPAIRCLLTPDVSLTVHPFPAAGSSTNAGLK